MSIPGSTNPLLLFGDPTGGQYQIQRSLRFNASDSGFCARTPAVAGNRRTWTWAGWVKRSNISNAYQRIFSARGAQNELTEIVFNNEAGSLQDCLVVEHFASGVQSRLVTTATFRDPSSWYHIVVAYDTTQTTSTDRVKVYVNNIQQTFQAGSYPTLNVETYMNSTYDHRIGAGIFYTGYLDGYLAECFLIDGQQLTPSSFTEVSATTGQLIPLAYTGTFGTNGFWLKFSDNSAATAAALGNDYSGNNNDWTPNNLSVTAGAGNDSLVDTPTSISATDTGVGGEIRGNYATLNPLNNPGGSTLSNGNLDCVTSSSLNGRVVSTIAVTSGKWYWEMLATNIATDLMVGISAASEVTATTNPASATTYLYDSYLGDKWNNGSHSAYGATYTTNDVIGVALNLDAGTLVFYKNGTSQGTAFSSLSGTFVAAFADGGTGTSSFTANFGQRAFAYPLSGFKALCDTNLGAPLVAKPNELFDALIWSGDSVNNRKLTTNFGPDLFWAKQRNGVAFHSLND